MIKLKLIIVILLCFQLNINSQNIKELTVGVSVKSQSKIENYKIPESILFVFKGDTHLVNYYLKLSDEIKKSFKNTEIKIDFNYALISSKPLRSDLEIIPKKIVSPEKFQTICHVSISDFVRFKRQEFSHNLNIHLKNKKTNASLMEINLNIVSKRTIATQLNSTSNIFFNLITK